MSEHSEYYHDADRNKPLPGAPVSSKEEVLQTLLDAARGENVALTEANKLLAAQVAGSYIVFNGPAIDAYGMHITCGKTGVRTARPLSLAEMPSRAAKVSARAADALSEPRQNCNFLCSTFDAKIWADEFCKRNSIADHGTMLGWFANAIMVGFDEANRCKSRAADALDSQPTEQRPTDDELWDATLRDRDAYHEWADKLADAIAVHCGVDIGEHSNQNLPWAEALEAIESADCIEDRSQPTDGEVRNG